MKKLLFFALFLPATVIKSYSQTPSAFGFFVGSSPCGNVIRPLLKIPLTEECEFSKWKLTLYQDPATLAPTTFKLICQYGVSQPNTSGFIGGGTSIETEGKWIIVKGSKTNPEAVVYQLNPDKPEISLSFVKMDENVIHLLYSDKSLMIGNSGYSYTFNKAKK